MNKKLKIVGICGSLRKESLNRKALNASRKFFPEDVEFETVEIGDIPFLIRTLS